MNDTDGSNWVDVAAATDVDEGQAIEVVVGEHIIALFRTADRYYALDGLCSHQGGPIANGELSLTDQGKSCVTCPWHGWQYELETGIQTVNRQPLQQTFDVRVKQGRLELRLS
ncbi:Rieske (2Fe-2S) protein [Roseiconus lacunae]|uniref:Rieske (2Fe-2S) protein n=1 Tax=Roseiconus lacunae TaxID=2605694 RepID=A0ABT7PJN7_9BACT|nr:Rieske (2Fe-2S) protein [Roseiconus lacunae]MDM4016702.1 Rieske (2Fe-2S) protein [Roseiconus lacunae]WRQ50984.1 Rieske (2Fe-2S) protein [Stieleria sp. HD01]